MHQHSHYRGPRRRRERKDPRKYLKRIIAEKFPNMGKEVATQVQEVQSVPGSINPRRNAPRYIVIKLTKTKVKGKITKYIQGNSQKVISWFLRRNSASQKGVA